MKKYNFNGRQYIDLIELRKEIRKLRKGIPLNYANFDKDRQAMVNLAYNDIGKVVYREELAKAKTPDAFRAVWDMPNEYVVHCGKNYFIEWQNGNAVIGGFDRCLGKFQSYFCNVSQTSTFCWRLSLDALFGMERVL